MPRQYWFYRHILTLYTFTTVFVARVKIKQISPETAFERLKSQIQEIVIARKNVSAGLIICRFADCIHTCTCAHLDVGDHISERVSLQHSIKLYCKFMTMKYSLHLTRRQTVAMLTKDKLIYKHVQHHWKLSYFSPVHQFLYIFCTLVLCSVVNLYSSILICIIMKVFTYMEMKKRNLMAAFLSVTVSQTTQTTFPLLYWCGSQTERKFYSVALYLNTSQW